MIICIDAGHGGRDPGAVGKNGTLEKNINLDIAKRVKAKLETYNLNVIMTRDNDTYVSLEDRVIIANKAKADYFISIHCNSALNYNVYGSSVYIVRKGTIAETLGGHILGELVKRGQVNRGINEATYHVLVKTTMPAVLVETDFISNEIIEKEMNKEEWREKIADGISEGIIKFLGLEKEVEKWKIRIMKWGVENLGISPEHKPDELAPKWFVIELIRRILQNKV